MTILPLGIAHLLEIELDDSKSLRIDSAGGGSFVALPSRRKVEYSIEKRGYRPIQWKSVAYFAEESAILLGHEDCLEKFDLTFCGPERTLQVLPRF
jgi:hypothetical protein